MAEMESDTDTMSPATSKSGNTIGLPRNDMCYLSPFTVVCRNERTISDSNLSSSGYSSMASPAPSRCGSSNPLYPHDIDDPSSSHGSKLHKMIAMHRSNSHGKDSGCGNSTSGTNDSQKRQKERSDSETLSDDILIESNDEGIGTDHIDEAGNRFVKDLEHFISKELLDSGRRIMCDEPSSTMVQLQIPTIVVQPDGAERSTSPVSSRSESPISERTTVNQFSPQFYNQKDQMLPFTDSDGLYDFPSSDGKGNSSKVSCAKKSNVKRRERKSSRSSKVKSFFFVFFPSIFSSLISFEFAFVSISVTSPTKSANVLDSIAKESQHLPTPQSTKSVASIRKSPKRRPMARRTIISSSSSSESLPRPRGKHIRCYQLNFSLYDFSYFILSHLLLSSFLHFSTLFFLFLRRNRTISLSFGIEQFVTERSPKADRLRTPLLLTPKRYKF